MKIKDIYVGKNKKELEKIVNAEYTKRFQGKCVINKETQIEICFNAIGKSKTAFGGQRPENYMTSYKASAIFHLDKLIENAKYIGIAQPKPKHVLKYKALGFLIFKIDCEIDNKKYTFKISAMIRKGGKIHYSINEDYVI